MDTLNAFKLAGADKSHGVLQSSLLTTSDYLTKLIGIGHIPKNWRRSNMVPPFNEGEKEDSGNYRLVSFTSIPRKLLEQIIKQLKVPRGQ